MSTNAGKTCSICGEWYQIDEFTYGNRNNRSYCKACNKEERRIYSKEGLAAAIAFKERQRAKWKND